MSFRCLCLFAVLGCQDRGSSSTAGTAIEPPAIELRDQGAIVARVWPGSPCRAVVDGLELLVGHGEADSLVAQHGATRWVTEQGDNGTTFRRNDLEAARIHAHQLFDEHGAPLVRVLENGDIVNGAGQLVRQAKVTGTSVTITPVVNPGHPAEPIVVTGTTHIELAAMLSAREATAEIRALAACHFLLPVQPRVP